MKIYIVSSGGIQMRVFLDKDIAKQYVDFVDTSPYRIDKYRIDEVEPSDELFKNFKILTHYWFRYELTHGKKHYFFLSSRELNSLDNEITDLNGEIKYKEVQYHNSEKPRVRSIVGSFYIEKRENEIDFEKYNDEFRSKCKDLVEKIIHNRTNLQWSNEQVNDWLPKEPFVIK